MEVSSTQQISQFFVMKKGIQRQFTCRDTLQQNAVAERKLAHLTSVSLSWIHDKNLPRELQAEAIQCACHVINKLPPWTGKEKSPFELLYGDKPVVDYFRVFGAICYVHIQKTIRSKLDPKAKKCIFVGYALIEKGGNVWIQSLRNLLHLEMQYLMRFLLRKLKKRLSQLMSSEEKCNQLQMQMSNELLTQSNKERKALSQLKQMQKK